MTTSDDEKTRQDALLRHLRHDPSFADAVLVAGDTEIPVHRALLSQLSPFLRKMLQHTQGVMPRITIQCASASSAGVLIDYAYGLNVSNALNLELALETLSVAAMLSVAPLMRIAARAALKGAKQSDPCGYARVFYALKQCGLEEEAVATLNALARDGRAWKATFSAAERLSAIHLKVVMCDRDLVASEDDLLNAVLSWVSVDPARRSQEAATRLLPLIRWQRLSARASRHVNKLITIAPGAVGQLAAARLCGGASLAHRAAPLPATSSGKALLGAPLSWATDAGGIAIENCAFGVQPFPVVFSRNYEFPVIASLAAASATGAGGEYYFDFCSLCMKLSIKLRLRECIVTLTVERRNRDCEIRGLKEALENIAIICETAVVSPVGVAVQNAFAMWPAVALAGFRKEGVERARKRVCGDGEGQMNVLSQVKLKQLLTGMESREEEIVTLAVRLKTVKNSALRAEGILVT